MSAANTLTSILPLLFIAVVVLGTIAYLSAAGTEDRTGIPLLATLIGMAIPIVVGITLVVTVLIASPPTILTCEEEATKVDLELLYSIGTEECWVQDLKGNPINLWE